MDPLLGMDATTAATTLATLVGLICNWKAERGAAATDRFQDFLTYLSEHQFEAIRSDIAASQELQVQLRGLLTLNLASMTEQLNTISQGVAALADKLGGLGPVSRAIGATGDGLSEQAVQMLKVFEQSEADEMLWLTFDENSFMLLPSQQGVSFSEKRFIRADLESLLRFGLFQQGETNSSDTKSFVLTRLGARYAANLPKVTFGNAES